MKKNILFNAAVILSSLLTVNPFSAFAAPVVEIHGSARLDVFYQDTLSTVEASNMIFPPGQQVPLDIDKPRHHSQFFTECRFCDIRLQARDEVCGWKIKAEVGWDFVTNESTGFGAIVYVTADRRARLPFAFIKAENPCGWYTILGQYPTLASNLEPEGIGYYPNICPGFTHDRCLIDRFGVASEIRIRLPQIQLGYKYYLNCEEYILFAASIERRQLMPVAGYNFPATGPGIVTGAGPVPFAGLTENPVVVTQFDLGKAQKCPAGVVKLGWYGYNPLQMEWAVWGTRNYIVFADGSIKFPAKVSWGTQVTVQTEWNNFRIFGHGNYLDGMSLYNGVLFPDVIVTDTSIPFVQPNFTPPSGRTSPTLKVVKNVKSAGGYGGISYQACNWVFYSMYGRVHAINLKTVRTAATHNPSRFVDGRLVDPNTIYKKISSITAGMIYTIWNDSFDIALEYKRWDIRALAGLKGHMNTYESMFRYRF